MAKHLVIPISKRSKEYGYLIWPARLDDQIISVLGKQENVRLYFDGSDRGDKNVDWKNRRISIGYKWTKSIPDDITEFHVHTAGSKLYISCQ